MNKKLRLEVSHYQRGLQIETERVHIVSVDYTYNNCVDAFPTGGCITFTAPKCQFLCPHMYL